MHSIQYFANIIMNLRPGFGALKSSLPRVPPPAPRVREEGEGVLRYQGDGQRKGSLADWRR